MFYWCVFMLFIHFAVMFSLAFKHQNEINAGFASLLYNQQSEEFLFYIKLLIVFI